MEPVNLNEIMKRTVSVEEYIDKMAYPFKDNFLERKHDYRVKSEVIYKLKEYAEDVVIVVFSAEWCEYCVIYVPILALLSKKTGIKVTIFGGLKTDSLNQSEIWRIPPSPPEIKTFNVDEIPHISILNKQGRQLGTIIGYPKPENTLEEEILEIIQQI